MRYDFIASDGKTVSMYGDSVRIIGRGDYVVVQTWTDDKWTDARSYDRMSDDCAWGNAKEHAHFLELANAKRQQERNAHVAEPFRAILNAFTPHIGG